MTPASIWSELSNLLDLLTASDLVLVPNPVRKIWDRRHLRVTAQGGQEYSPVVVLPFASVVEYRTFVEQGLFSCILMDGALIHISYDFDGDELVRHKLLYYPCPYILPPELLREEPLLDVLEYVSSCGSGDLRLRSPLRFDYDPLNAKEHHAHSHLHLVSEDCRWPVVGPVSIGRFIDYVFRHFYFSLWRRFRFLRDWSKGKVTRTLLDTQSDGLHVAFRIA